MLRAVRGASAVMTAFFIALVLLPLGSLVVDMARLYVLRTEIFSAIHAGSLAGSRNLLWTPYSESGELTLDKGRALAEAKASYYSSLPSRLPGAECDAPGASILTATPPIVGLEVRCRYRFFLAPWAELPVTFAGWAGGNVVVRLAGGAP
jgi:hypothetical protein